VNVATTKAKADVKIGRQLIKHVLIAKALGIDAATLRRWVADGLFPEPHSDFGATWLYDRELIDHFLASGKWPAETKFRAGVGKGRQAPNPSPSTNGAAVS
jgi:hypothetical protein